MITYSYSKLDTYKTCPKKYQFKYIDNIKCKNPNKSVFERGSFAHSILEKYPNLDDFQNKTDQFELLIQVKSFIENQNLNDYLLNKKIKSEYRFYLSKSEDNKIVVSKNKKNSIFNGIIDFIGKEDDCILLIDWKTGKSKANIEQLKFYSLFIFTAFTKINKIKLMLYYIDQNIKEELIIFRNEYDEIKDYFLNLVDTIENSKSFKEKCNKYCEYCEYFKICKPFSIKKETLCQNI